jgi:Putative peptidoglycan binding domain
MEVETYRSTARMARRGAVALLVLACAPALAPAASGQVGGGTPPTGDDPTTGGAPPPGEPPTSGSPHPAFNGNGMWIWQLPRAHGGSVSRIVAKARRHNVKTLFIKSGDGTSRWRQFSPSMVSAFKRAGLRVCGWQYMYGNSPIAEASVSAWAKQAGADCFVIDAEAEYEGKYVSADRYVRRLRALVGNSFPIALAPFPYVDFHPSFPYSVFLAPGAAEVNQPQMYWRAIGTSVDTNFSHTYTWSRLYKRPIFPLGQTYNRAPPAQVRRFRQVAQAYGAGGVSWWEWAQTTEAAWLAVGDPVTALRRYRLANTYPRLRLRARGDFVVWAQQHLWSAGYRLPLDGVFSARTRSAVLDFQTERGLAPTGTLDDPTWRVLLRLRPVAVRWRTRGRATPATAAGHGAVSAPAPRSASLPAKAYEIPRKR